jgi:hypothetical protein
VRFCRISDGRYHSTLGSDQNLKKYVVVQSKKGGKRLGYEIALTLGDRLLSAFPGVILKRIYTRAKLDKEIRIDTRTTNPLIASLGAYVPDMKAWFTVTNFTNLTWKVCDFSAEVWLEQPIAITTCVNKPEIARKSKQDISTKCFLSETQTSRLVEAKQRKNSVATIYLSAYLQSRIGLMEFAPTLENRQIIIQ